MNKQQALKAVVDAMHHVWAYGRKADRGIVEGWDTGLAWQDTDAQRAEYAARVTRRANEMAKKGSPVLQLAA